MSSQLPTSKLLFISFTFFRSSTLVRTVTWIEPLCFRLGRDLAGFSGPFSRARCRHQHALQNANEMVTRLR